MASKLTAFPFLLGMKVLPGCEETQKMVMDNLVKLGIKIKSKTQKSQVIAKLVKLKNRLNEVLKINLIPASINIFWPAKQIAA
jgi:hypothetical protein